MISQRRAFKGLSNFRLPRFVRRLLQPGTPELTRKHVVLGETTDEQEPVRVLHLSDFHASGFVPCSLLEQAVNLGLGEQPHAICLTGDFVTDTIPDDPAYAALLRRLAKAAPTFACLGNHDGGAWIADHGGYRSSSAVADFLRMSGIDVLENDSREIRVGCRDLRMVGIGDVWAEEADPAKAFHGSSSVRRLPTLVLAHNPDTKTMLAQHHWDILLSGHTHGGQIVFPLLGAPVVPVEDRRFIQGLHPWNGQWIHVTRGLGSIFGVRMNCSPEVSVLTLL